MIGYIYEIVSKYKNITKVYIGSTWYMNDRNRRHKSRCNNENDRYYNLPVYCYIREHGGWNNFNMNIIESGDCMDKNELECAEQLYIDMNGGIKNLLNSCDAYNTPEQRKEKKNICDKNLRKRNIESKKYYCKFCNKSFQDNYELQIHQKTKTHYNKINNIDTTNKICIPCNKTFHSNYHLQRHLKTNKHKNNIT